MGDLRIRALIEAVLKGKGLQDASKGTERLDKGAKKARKSVAKLDGAMGSLKRQIAGLFGGAVLFRFVQGAVETFADWERQIAATRGQARNLGIDLEETERHVRNLTTSIEQQTGILRQETTPIFNKFLGLTQDTQQATLLLRAAVGAQEKQFNDVATAANLLGSILQGEVREPAKSLGLAFDQARDSAEQQAEVLQTAIDMYLDLSDVTGDARGSLDAMSATMTASRITIGEALAPAIDAMNRSLQFSIKVVRTLGNWIFTQVSAWVGAFEGFGSVLAAVFDRDKYLAGPEAYFDSLREVVRREDAKIRATFAQGAADRKRIWDEQSTDIVQTEDQMLKALQQLLEAANTRAKKAAEKRRAREAEEADRLLRKRKEIEARAEDELLAQQIRKAEEGSQQRLELEVRLLRRTRDRALAAENLTEEAKQAIRERFRLAEEELQREYDERRTETEQERIKRLVDFELQAQRDLLAAKIELEESGSDERRRLEMEQAEEEYQAELERAEQLGLEPTLIHQKWKAKKAAITKKYGDAEAQYEEWLAQQKKRFAQDVAQHSIQTAMLVFGQNKALRIAQAIIDTWAGAARAFHDYQWPYSAVVAAIVAAQGLARVAQIKNTNPSKNAGFDVPAHDTMAQVGGARWAQDMVRNFTDGVGRGWADALGGLSLPASAAPAVPAGATTNRYDQGMTIHIGNVYGGRRGLRHLSRELTKISRLDHSRRIR